MSAAFADFGKDPTQTGLLMSAACLSRVLAEISEGRTHSRISRRLIVGFGSSIAENEVPDAHCAESWSLRRADRAWVV